MNRNSKQEMYLIAMKNRCDSSVMNLNPYKNGLGLDPHSGHQSLMNAGKGMLEDLTFYEFKYATEMEHCEIYEDYKKTIIRVSEFDSTNPTHQQKFLNEIIPTLEDIRSRFETKLSQKNEYTGGYGKPKNGDIATDASRDPDISKPYPPSRR